MADILSVGIDIGTSTTQLVFSRITLKNTVGYFSVPQVAIVAKHVVYQSDVHLTPLKTPTLIDGERIRALVAEEYRLAGYMPADVDTGAVIITGESACKENAALVLERLSDYAGDFVVSTAGPDLESVIAGKGSGAYQDSLENSRTVVNMDIGGGTTNIVVFDCGEVRAKGCLNIGGRLVRLRADLTVEAVSPAVMRIAQAIPISLRPGQRTTVADLSKLTDRMALLLAQALSLAPQEPLLQELWTQGSSRLPPDGRPVARICFSGGVADCLEAQSDSPIPFGDIGLLLGHSMARQPALAAIPRLAGRETIRATVVGTGTYTTTITGSTIRYVEELLPLKNLPALKLTEEEQNRCFAGDGAALADKTRWFLAQCDAPQILLAMRGVEDPTYEMLRSLAATLAKAMDESLPDGAPVLIALEQDIAQALGLQLVRVLQGRRAVACIDGVHVEQGDYVDLGKPVMDGLVIPVVVKTLLFG